MTLAIYAEDARRRVNAEIALVVLLVITGQKFVVS